LPQRSTVARASYAREDLERLALLARPAHPGATAELCHRCRGAVFAYMLRALESREDAEEATQQVMLSVLEALPRYRQNGKPFLSWVFAIAHNHACDFHRRRERTVAMEPADLAWVRESLDTAPARAIPRDPHSALRELIAPLSPAHQQVLTLLYEHDLSPEQAAAVLGRTPASVRQEHRRARAKLAAIVALEAERVFADEMPALARYV
jgi:RNA polymerase sigma-70 factor, ECF subfamily